MSPTLSMEIGGLRCILAMGVLIQVEELNNNADSDVQRGSQNVQLCGTQPQQQLHAHFADENTQNTRFSSLQLCL